MRLPSSVSAPVIAIAVVVATATLSLRAQPQAPALDREALAAEVRAEFLHAWNGYTQYAWGHDELKPVSKTPHDWHDATLLMTPVDALDTMILMGLDRRGEGHRRLHRRRTSRSTPTSG